MIRKEIIKRVNEENKKAGNKLFVTISYDLLSENRKHLDDKQKRAYRTMRLTAYREITKQAIKLNQSTYIIKASRLHEILKRIEDIYRDELNNISLEIVGNVYEDVAISLLQQDIDHLENMIKEEIEKAQMILEDDEAEEEEIEKAKKRLYRLRHSIDALRNRIEDYAEIKNKNLDDAEIKNMLDYCERLDQARRKLINSVS